MPKKQKKKKDKKNKDKKERKQKSQEAKAERTTKKVMNEDGEDIDAILTNLTSKRTKGDKAVITEAKNPSPRCNGTLVAHPTSDKLYLYGGEYFDGKVTTTFGDLFVCNLANMDFKKIDAPNPPLPRNSHQAVISARQGGQMWVYGGEFTSPKGNFRHYRDLWVFELKTNTWTEVRSKGAPSQRSGHRMIALPNKLIVFGGFYDSGKHITNYNDLHVFNLEDMTWSEIKQPSSGRDWPPARAGHQFILHAKSNTAILYGGVRMEVKTKESNTHYMNDIWSLNLETFKWSKVRAKGAAPNPRAGMTMAMHKDRAILFGGSTDIESELDFDTTCHSDLFSFAPANSMFNTVVPKKGVAPHPRRHAQMVVKGNKLVVFGGVLEQKKKEITLNDWQLLDLKKLDAWETLIGMDIEAQEWLGSDDDEQAEEEEGSEPEEDFEEPEDPNAEVAEEDIPMDNENLREFFARSKEFWTKIAQEQNGEANPKALRKLAFELCKDRFEEYE